MPFCVVSGLDIRLLAFTIFSQLRHALNATEDNDRMTA